MIEVIAALIRWLGLASCPIRIRGHDDAVCRICDVETAHFSDEDPEAKHHNTVSEEWP